VGITYIYPASYRDPRNPTSQGGVSVSLFGSFGGDGLTFSSERAGGFFRSRTVYQTTIGSWDAQAQGLGGWSLNIHHAYNPVTKVLHLGDGSRRSVDSLGQIITTVAGGQPGSGGDGGPATQAQLSPVRVTVGPDGSLYISVGSAIRRVNPAGIITTVAGTGRPCSPATAPCGDGGPAIQAQFQSSRGIAMGLDGSLYIADSDTARIHRVGPDGIITTVAGNGTFGSSGDGGPATQAQLFFPVGVAVGPDGSLYIAERGSRIRRVGPNGIITTVAGTGVAGFSGDGGPASQAQLNDPWAVAVGPDGSLYIADMQARRVRRVGPNGIITTVAGNGTFGSSGDGGPATQAQFQQLEDIAVGPDSSLYITDYSSGRVRRVGPDGIITTVAGTAPVSFFRGEGGPATQAQLVQVHGVAFGPDNSLYLADTGASRLLRVAPAFTGVSFGDTLIASADGTEVYAFNAAGRHQRTLHALTGAVRLQFAYDTMGHLTTVTDGDGNVTTVEHDASGAPTALVGPFGQRTILTVDANGYLAHITNPASETTALTSTSDGLLTSLTDPRGHTYQFTYDAQGRLTRDADPAGGFKALTRTDVGSTFTVDLSTALGRTTTYTVESLSTGDQHRVNTFPDGTQTVELIGTNGSWKTTLADGSVTNLLQGPDPRFAMQAAIPKSLTTTTGGLTSTFTTQRSVTLATPTDPLSLTSQSDTIQLNGRIFASVYNAATKTTTNTSAVGRKVIRTIDLQGRITQAQVSGLLPVSYSYDPHGRLASRTQGTGAETRAASFSYNSDGYLDTVTDPLGRTVHLQYDAAGRVTRQTLPNGQEILSTYDANSNLTSLTPPGRPAHVFAYTPVDLTEAYTPPSVGPGTTNTLYTFNADRQLTRVTRPDGETLSFDYNSTGQLSTLSLSRGQISYVYSPSTSQLTSVTAPDGGTLTSTYTGALLTQVSWAGTVAGSVSRTYDSDFRVSSLSVNGGSPVVLQYDADSLLTKAGDLTLSRDVQNGLLTGSTLGSITDSWNYNGLAEPANYSAAYNATSLYTVQYTRDTLGRITDKTETIGGITNTYSYSYDLAGRLTEVKQNGTTISSYTYDSNGNQLSVSSPGGTIIGSYDNQDRLTQSGSTAYTYTANGELQSKTIGGQTTSYQYDTLGNLMAVTLPDGTQVSYLIDGQTRRIGKQVNGTLVQGFLYQDDLHPIAELDGSNTVVSRFVYASRRNVPDYLSQGGTIYRIIADHLGSPRLVVNTTTGQVVQRMDYDAFGNVTRDTNPGFQPFGFAGGLYDRETQLVRFGVRDYDAATGRWTAKDPILFAGSDTNLYGYVVNEPVNRIDPSGLDTYMCIKLIDFLSGTNTPNSQRRSGPDIKGNPLYHKYICIDRGGIPICGGLTEKHDRPFGPGKPSDDRFLPDRCEKVASKDMCLEMCLLISFSDPRPDYSLINIGGQNCQSWADETYARCALVCGDPSIPKPVLPKGMTW
jgi:RHS repeat-associated protein